MLRRLSNAAEHRVYDQLLSVADRYGAEIYRKVRVADVVDIDQLNLGDLRRYALMAHFDFVVTDSDHEPHFAVEFDGPGHSSQHDAKKDAICTAADFGLFRVGLPTSQTRVGHLSFLNYLTHLWFLGLAYLEMRDDGVLPPDEPFVASAFLRPDAKSVFDSEFDLVGPARKRVTRFCESHQIGRGSLAHLDMAEILMVNEAGSYAAFCRLPIEQTILHGWASLVLKVPSAGRLQDVPFAKHELGQFCTALAYGDLLDEIQLFHSGGGHVVRSPEEIRTEIARMKDAGYSMLMGLNWSC